MTEFLQSPLYHSLDLLLMAGLLVVQSLMAVRLLRTSRTVVRANAELLTTCRATIKLLEEQRDILVSQQTALRETHKAALFWYTLWLQAVGRS
jgi:hypothetical protein